MSQDHNHLNHTTCECKWHSCSLRVTARNCYLDKSGGTWVLYFTTWRGARNAGLKRGTAQNVECKLRNFLGHKFWARGYFVSTVGQDEKMIRAGIKNWQTSSWTRRNSSRGRADVFISRWGCWQPTRRRVNAPLCRTRVIWRPRENLSSGARNSRDSCRSLGMKACLFRS